MRREEIYLDRLERLADELTYAWPPGVGFNLNAWEYSNELGFARCAVGHAASSERFPGLVLQSWDPLVTLPALARDKSVYGWHAVTRYFGVTFDEACDLFSGSRAGIFDLIVSRGRFARWLCARRIRRYVARHREPLMEEV